MSLFVLISIALIVLAYALLFGYKKQSTDSGNDRRQLNIEIARDQIRDLEKERDAGLITQQQFEQASEDVEKNLLTDVSDEVDATTAETPSYVQKTGYIILFFIPAFSFAVYFYLGNPKALEPQVVVQQNTTTQDAHTGQGNAQSVQVMVQKLRDKLDQQPDNAEGGLMLGKSYMAFKQFNDAVYALEKAYNLIGENNPDVMLRYADALAMANNGRLAGKPLELVERALSLQPDSIIGLWLAGMAYNEQGDYALAIKYWRRLEPKLANDPGSQAEVRSLIARAESNLGIEPTAPAMAQAPAMNQQPVDQTKSISISVMLDDQLTPKVSPDDLVFIYAKAVSGPPMPLAAVRVKVSDLPLQIVLDDSQAMMPTMKLSSQQQVTVGARVSKSGQPVPQSGDIQGEVTPVQVGTAELVQINIKQIVP